MPACEIKKNKLIAEIFLFLIFYFIKKYAHICRKNLNVRVFPVMIPLHILMFFGHDILSGSALR